MMHRSACCPSFDVLSINGDYDADLNEKKTVCERSRLRLARKTAKSAGFHENLAVQLDENARKKRIYFKFGIIPIKTYKTCGNKGIMTKCAKNL